MKKLIVILLWFISLTGYCQVNWQWANEIRSNQDEKILDIITDPSNGVTYACGFFEGNLSGIYTTGLNGTPNMSAPTGVKDGLVAKYDAAGNVIWAFKVGGVGAVVEIEAITIAPNGNFYITGDFFNGIIDFKGVASSISVTQTEGGFSRDMFLAAYNPGGELLWVTRSIDTGNTSGFGITADVNGIYVAGRFSGDITFPPLAPENWVGNPFSDGFITKFDFSGNAIRVKTIFNTLGDGAVNAFNVVTDGTSVYAVGTSGASSWTFGPTGFNPTDNNNGVAGTDDIWIISIRENNFNLNWSQVIGSTEDDIAKGIAVDATSIYLTGGLGGTSINFPGIAPVVSVGTAKDIFTGKLFNGNGITDWVQMEQNSTASDAFGNDIVLDLSGNLYATGNFRGTTNFNGGSNSVTSTGLRDVFVMSRKTDGTFNWVKTAGSNANDQGLGISYDNNGNIYVGGFYKSAATFGAFTLTNDLLNNGFLAKLNSCAINITCPSNQTVTANASCQFTLLDYTSLAITSASCGVASVTQIPVVGTVVNSGVNPITLFLTDNNGNVDSCSFDLIVEAAVNPTVVSCGTYLFGETTVGQGNTGNNFGCVGFPTPGEDVYYQITVPTGNFWLQITIENVVDANDPWLETFWVGGGCPLGGGCITSNFYDIATQQFSTGGSMVQYLAVGPGTYYFVVDAQNDGIDSYDIKFDCLESGIEFDESISCGDPDNDGIIPYVNGSTTLTTQTCQSVNICHDMYIANLRDVEWIDSVYMDLGDCYTNVVPTIVAGFYQPGNWVGTYSAASNGISWMFNNTSVAIWGDGAGGSYSCDNGSTRLHTLCFTADISSTCMLDSNLNIFIKIVDDGIGSAGNIVAGIDVVLSDDFTITNPSPTITCPTNITINNDFGTCNAVVSGITPTINDNCPNPFTIYTLTGATTGSGTNDASGTTFNVGITTIQYLVTDSVGAKDSCSFTITVIDNENPMITCAINISIGNDIGVCTAVVSGILPVFNDNCGIDSVNYVLTGVTTGSGLNDASGITFNPGITTVTYTVTDLSGNTTNCNFTISVTDNVNPTIMCPTNVTTNTVLGTCGVIVNGITPIANDNCGVDSVSYVLTGTTTGSGLNDASGTTFNLGVTTVTYTITDLSGNTASCNFTVTIIDNEAPTFACPVNNNENVDANCNFTIPDYTGTLIGLSDNCTASGAIVITQLPTIGTVVSGSGTTQNIKLFATDASGNIDSCLFTITLIDNINPTITCSSNINVNTVLGTCGAVVNGILPVSLNDNCGIDSVNYVLTGVTTGFGLNDASGTTFNLGISTVTYTITDLSGNTANCNFTVTVMDNEVPTITCPININTNNDIGICGAVVNGILPVSINDNCGIDSVNYVLAGATTGSGLNDVSGTTFNLGITTVTYTITDLSGNTASCNFTVTIIDNEAPTFACPVNNNENVDANCNFTIPDYTGTLIGLSDNCTASGAIVITQLPTIGTVVSGSGTTQNIKLFATDASGNIDSCLFTITLIDNINPIIICPTNVTTNTGVGTCGAVVNGILPVSINDNCGIDSVNYVLTGVTTGSGLNDASGTTFNLGVTTVTYTVTDLSGNTTNCNFTITVIDNINPIIICPTNVVVNTVLGTCGAVVNGILPVSINDNCGIDSVNYVLTGVTTGSGLNDASGTTFNLGITTVTYTVVDLSGNTVSCNFIVTVMDNEAPTITCPTNININNDNGVCGAVVTGIIPINVSDNCAIDSVNYVLTGATTGSGLNDASGTTFNVGITTVTYQITDMAGNTASCNFTVTVIDNEVPTFTCPVNSNENVDVNCNFTIPNYTGTLTGLSDNCTPTNLITVTQLPTAGTVISGSGATQNIKLFAIDAAGNIDSCSFTITLIDTIKPTITCGGSINEMLDNNCSFTVIAYSPLTLSDNCTIQNNITLTQTPLPGTIITTDTLITLIADDGNGNIDSCSFMLFLVDSINPIIICPNDTIINNDLGVCSATIQFGIPVNSDNCGVNSLLNDFNNTNNASDTYLVGVTTVAFTVIDNTNNIATCSFLVTVIDAEAPAVICSNDTIINADNNSCNAIFNYNITAFDNCGFTINQISGLPSGAVFPLGITTNTYVAIDSSGLADTCSFIVTVIDNQLPTIICPNDTILCDVNVTIPLPIVNDNCTVVSITNNFNGTNNASGIYPTGITTVDWIVTDGNGNTNTCISTVEIEIVPTVANAGEDQYVLINQNTNLTANNITIGVGTWSLISGGGIIDDIFNPLSYVFDLNMGANIFRWTTENGTCPSSFDEVTITVGGLNVPTGFSPNKDGNNDLFVIPGIEELSNEVVIFNRWGIEVYKKNNYQNDWNGISDDGKTLPEDTYFYVVKLIDFSEEQSGYVVIKR